MRWIFLFALSVMMSPGAWSMSLQKRQAYIAPPFSVPGQIIEGITVTDLVEVSGDIWTADTALEGAAQACRRIAPAISAFLPSIGVSDPIVDSICDAIESANVEEECGTAWDELVVLAGRPDLVDGSQSLVPNLRCRENDYDYPNISDYGSPSDYGFPSDWNVSFSYNGLPSVTKRFAPDATSLNDINPYDPCSEKGIERVNNIIFALADWFGPTLFDAIYGGGGDPYVWCGLMRYILSMNVQEAIQQAIGILKFPLADILETLQPLDICTLISELAQQLSEEEAEAFAVSKAVLEQLSGLSEQEFCDFMAGEQTREAYLDQAETIISNAIFLIHDEPRCNSILDIVAPTDQMGIFHMVTGYNISIESERNEFCSEFVAAYDLSSTYVPPPYELPPDVDINDFTPFETPGELLPGLTFIDLLKLDGVGYRSELFIDAVAIYCDVFEDFLAPQIPEDQFDVRGFCTGARNRALGHIEEFCLAETVPGFYSEDRPLGLRPFNPLTVDLYTYRVLSGIDDISKEGICPAVDRLLTGNSVPELKNQGLDIFLTEALPAVNGLCENWEAALCYLKPYCPVPEPATEAPERNATGDSWYYYTPYIPDPEEIERINVQFDEAIAGLENIAWLMTGFDSREEGCAFVARSIDPLSGRGDGSGIAVVRDSLIGVVYDVDRCSRIVDAALDLIPEEAREQILTGGNTNLVYQITGYQTSREFCQEVARAHTEGGGPPPTVPPGPGGVATYNVVANIVVHIQRVARSIL